MKTLLLLFGCVALLISTIGAGRAARATSVAAATTPPTITDIEVAVNADSAVISWTTDKPATTSVLYGETRFHEAKSTGAIDLVTAHRAVLVGLRPATTYHYQVVSLDQAGNPASSEDLTFMTNHQTAPSRAIAQGDGAVSPPPWDTLPAAPSRAQIAETPVTPSCSPVGNHSVYLPLVLSGVPTSTEVLTSTAAPAASSARLACTTAGIQSDDFNTNSLDQGRWQFINPGGDATLQLNGTDALISVPAGTYHNVWSDGIFAPRLMQPAPNTDFEVEVKFESAPAGTYAMQGILVEADSKNLLRFDFYSVGTSQRIFAASFVNGTPTTRSNQAIANGLPMYMRVKRTGDLWAQSYSYDGLSWTPNVSFTHALSVTSVGVFVGNAGQNTPATAPAYTSSIDYFFNTLSPTVPEDPNAPQDTTPPAISSVQFNAQTTTLSVNWATDEPATGKVEYGLTQAYELGAISQSGHTTTHTVEVGGLQPDTTYQFRISSTDTSNNTATSQNLLVRTKAGYSGVPVIDVWYGPNQTFGQTGNAQQWVNILGRVSDPDGIATLRYSLNGGPPVALSIGPDKRRLYGPGDFNVEIDRQNLLNGNNTVTISATDTLGNQSAQNVSVQYTAGVTAPLPYNINWGAVSSIQQAAQVVDGLWTLGNGSVRTVEVGYDRLIDIGDVAWKDYEVTVPITIHSFNPGGFQQPSNGQGIGVLLRWKGHYAWDSSQPRYGYNPKGAIGWYSWSSTRGYRLSILGNSDVLIAEDTSGRKLSFDVRYIFKMRVASRPNQTSMYYLKVWQDGTPEPATWDLSAPNFPGELTTGSLLLVAHQTDASFGNVSVVPVAPATASNSQ